MEQTKTLQASKTPQKAIELLRPPKQEYRMRQYQTGYERYMNEMPRLNDDDEFLQPKVKMTTEIMGMLAEDIRRSEWVHEGFPEIFDRKIIGIENPLTECNGIAPVVVKENSQILVARWGKGFTSPIHGHANGMLHEDILFGKVLVNSYRIVKTEIGTFVRTVETKVVEKGVFASQYNKKKESQTFRREALVHNFVALEPSATLHYLPEHTRDGRDNGFTAQYFEDHYDFMDGIEKITPLQGMYSAIGEVILVRSNNVSEYGDHYIVITGKPEMKPHGLRPRDIAIQAPHAAPILDAYDKDGKQPVTLLRLSKEAKEEFYKFHGIEIIDNKIIFPNI